MTRKLAVVTGANRGIGFAIVRGLCRRFDGDVFLTSRDVERGKRAVQELQQQGLNPKYHQLDVTEKESLIAFHDFIQENYDGIDVLINNVGILNNDEPELTIAVNYYAMVLTTDILFLLLKRGARVINMSSELGHLSRIPDASIRNRFQDPNLTIEDLTMLMEEYLEDLRKGMKNGIRTRKWGSPYVVSKVAVTALSMIQQRELIERDIKVNAVHPGYVDTDLTSHRGPLTIDQGAEAPLYLALDAPDSIQGQYVWCNKQVVSWVDPPPFMY